jgi:L-arabinose isomerase
MIDMLATLTRTELAVIDEQTTPRSFANELRFNDLYYHLSARP